MLFEVDEYTDTDAWSVIVRGAAHRLDSAEEVRAADRLPLRPWTPTLKYNYIEIVPDEISARRFEFGPEPERYPV